MEATFDARKQGVTCVCNTRPGRVFPLITVGESIGVGGRSETYRCRDCGKHSQMSYRRGEDGEFHTYIQGLQVYDLPEWMWR